MELNYTTTDSDIILIKNLEVGDWFTFKSNTRKNYVYKVVEDTIYYSSPSFSNSDSVDLHKANCEARFL